ncbi:hypothetical protein C922_00897 [Plasmodium inui San Antonio 1]|uniref:Rhomboid-like protease n=1 Tax=Plasmodium inui San Antonio 1 TaxID=1237626 RepID=W7ASS4_9APIC|nr:hypothetical protein C922_00897 [Plasmodium inui San Antonio 1]EUD68501.1 hypothetical protein C922_00897 [Plasmodium inui San Antonio 1]
MTLFPNSNNSKANKFRDENLLTCRYTRSFNKTFKKDITFIQILFPFFTVKSITTSFSLLLFFTFFILNVCNFDRQSPLYLSETVLKRYGMIRNSVTNNHQYYKLLTATFFHSSVWNLIINVYYLMNIGIIVERSYGKARYMAIMLLSVLCGNFLLCATSNCGDVHMGISTILSGFMGLFLQEIVVRYKQLTDRSSVIRKYVFAVLSLYLTISIFPFNGNIVGNLGAIFGGFCYPYFTRKGTFHGQEKKVKLTLAVLLILLLSSTLISLIVAKC